jgi:hypothetical protein
MAHNTATQIASKDKDALLLWMQMARLASFCCNLHKGPFDVLRIDAFDVVASDN